MYQDYIVGEHKADKGKRFINYIVDIIAYLAFTFCMGLFLGVFSMVSNIDLPENDLFYNILGIGCLIIYYFVIETLTKGRSIGKFITGTKVVMIDSSTPTTKDYFMRSLCRIIPFEPLTFLGENGWHDSITKTTVVNKKTFELDLSSQDSIEHLGHTEIEETSIK